MSNEKQSTKGILEWIREILGLHEKELTEMESPPTEEMVEKLIDKAVTGKIGKESGTGKRGDSENSENSEDSEDSENQQPSSCSYALKRNIVASLQAIREFAQKHKLGETMLRAILSLLGELAVGALKGKVGEKTLEALLKALTFQQHADEAYLRGRNEKIEIEYFPKPEEIPHLGGMIRNIPDENNIFSLAKEA